MLELSPRNWAGMGRKSSRGFWLELVQVGCSEGPCPPPPGMVTVAQDISGSPGVFDASSEWIFFTSTTPSGIGRKLQAPEVILFHLTEHKSASQLPFGLILIPDLPLPHNPPGRGELTG